MKPPIPLGVIGGGDQAAVLADHRAPLPQVRIARWAGGGTQDRAAASAMAERLGVPFAAEWEAVAADPGLPGILVLTRDPARPAIVAAALSAGKVVLCPVPAADQRGRSRPHRRRAAAGRRRPPGGRRAAVHLGRTHRAADARRRRSRRAADRVRRGAPSTPRRRAGSAGGPRPARLGGRGFSCGRRRHPGRARAGARGERVRRRRGAGHGRPLDPVRRRRAGDGRIVPVSPRAPCRSASRTSRSSWSVPVTRCTWTRTARRFASTATTARRRTRGSTRR